MLAIIAVCLLGGVAFAGLAVILTRSKGNTLKDVLNSEAFKNSTPESLKVEIDRLQGKFKASTQIPVVALYAVSALVALGVPALMIYKQGSGEACEEGEVTLSGTIRKSAEGNVFLIPTELKVEPSGFFTIPLSKSEVKRDFNIESESHSPLTLNLEYGRKEQKLYVNLNNVASDTLPVDTLRNTVRLPRPIELAPRASGPVVNRVTDPSPAPSPTAAEPAELRPFNP